MSPEPSDACCDGRAGSLAGLLAFAAPPCFLGLALYTGPMDGAPLICSMSLLSGMAPMYLLMALFHAAPWVLLAERCVLNHSTVTLLARLRG